MCDFHGSNGNGFGDIWWTDKLFYFSSIVGAGGAGVGEHRGFLHDHSLITTSSGDHCRGGQRSLMYIFCLSNMSELPTDSRFCRIFLNTLIFGHYLYYYSSPVRKKLSSQICPFLAVRPQFDSDHHQNSSLCSQSYYHESVILFVFLRFIFFKLRRVCIEFKCMLLRSCSR